jgi:hypothetical protein
MLVDTPIPLYPGEHMVPNVQVRLPEDQARDLFHFERAARGRRSGPENQVRPETFSGGLVRPHLGSDWMGFKHDRAEAVESNLHFASYIADGDH